jgi:hypothetical protein
VLREQEAHASLVAQAKVSNNLLEREMDRSYRDLGEAVWAASASLTGLDAENLVARSGAMRVNSAATP